MEVKSVHFGHYVWHLRIKEGWTVRQLAQKARVTEPTIFAIQKSPAPAGYDSTFGRLAAAFGKEPEQLDREWRSTPVTPPKKRRSKVAASLGLSAETTGWLKGEAHRRGATVEELVAVMRSVCELHLESFDRVFKERERVSAEGTARAKGKGTEQPIAVVRPSRGDDGVEFREG